MRRTSVVLAAVVLAAAVTTAPAADASRFIQRGIFDDAQILFGDPDKVFPTLRTLRAQVLRVNLWWGGPVGVADQRPVRATDPADPAYDWSTYDRTVRYAAAYGMKVMFSIVGTPPWANGGLRPNVPPRRAGDLKDFVRAAARRYDGTYRTEEGTVVPAVRLWLAWNEPNNPTFLTPQYVRRRSRWVIASGRAYAQICNAVVTGVKLVRKNRGKVACGVTGPRGNNNPNSARPSVAPLAFLRAMKAAGARGFDAFAHHPYYGTPSETPATPPPLGARGQAPTAVTLGNLDVFVRELTRLYGNVRIWITEYGYQTRPPDTVFGVTYAKQSLYLSQSYARARAHRRVDMYIWFLLRDEPLLAGWQSGLLTAAGKRKPAFRAFQRL